MIGLIPDLSSIHAHVKVPSPHWSSRLGRNTFPKHKLYRGTPCKPSSTSEGNGAPQGLDQEQGVLSKFTKEQDKSYQRGCHVREYSIK